MKITKKLENINLLSSWDQKGLLNLIEIRQKLNYKFQESKVYDCNYCNNCEDNYILISTFILNKYEFKTNKRETKKYIRSQDLINDYIKIKKSKYSLNL